MDPFKTQVGGNHYTKLPIQPIEMALKFGCTPTWCKVMKYTCRMKTDPLEDSFKAYHIACLEEAKSKEASQYPRKMGEMFEFYITRISANPLIQSALTYLQMGYYTLAKDSLKRLIVERGGDLDAIAM